MVLQLRLLPTFSIPSMAKEEENTFCPRDGEHTYRMHTTLHETMGYVGDG
jgi:hypothetical protein